jgi:F0F1-type ATP synthase assembly protein I
MAEDPRPWRRYLRFSSLGIELGLAVVLGLMGGQWLDKQFGTAPWLLLAGLLIGLAAGFRGMLRALKGLSAPPPDSGSKQP